ncbi:MAG TPA: glycosyltransferase family 39 protein [Saprospiraceae bacterium]|nr:glycosyltransferase family 39 protein [Saprospiraceae bacterium]
MNKQETIRHSFFWALVAAILFIPFLGGVHLFDWDEINFAEISREMILQRDYLRVSIDFEPFYQKPPFFFWLQVLSMKLFGISEFAARLPNALCGIITIVLLYNLGRRLYTPVFGHFWALAYLGSVLPFLYFKSGIIDPWFNLFIFLGLYYAILYYWKKEGFAYDLRRASWYYLFWAGLFTGLGILTKGPVAFLVISLTFFVYWVYQRFRFYITIPAYLFFTVIAFLLTATWFGIETLINGPDFVKAFFAYNVELATTESAGHGGFPGYHFVVLLLGVFPASVFALRAFGKLPSAEQDYQNDFRIWMKYIFWVVLILFTIVESKIVHYSSMCYFPLTYLGALVLYHFYQKKLDYRPWLNYVLWGIALIYLLVILGFTVIGQNIEQLQRLVDDPFAKANMDAQVNWTGWEAVPAVVLIAMLWSFHYFRKKEEWQKAVTFLFGGGSLFVLLMLVSFIRRVEGYSQRANIAFFESLRGEDAYVYTYGYKSFAHLYYTDKEADPDAAIYEVPKAERESWLMTGQVDKPVYFSVRIHRADVLRAQEDFEELYEKNGFVFFKRSHP